MQRQSRWILWSLGSLLAFLLFAVALLMLAANSRFGRTLIERAVSTMSAEQIIISGLNGRFPEQLTVKHIELRDSGGSWLSIDELMLNWLPGKLLTGEVAIDNLYAQRIVVERLPMTTAEAEKPGGMSLPLTINLRGLQVEHLELEPTLAGSAASLAIDGRLRLVAANRGEIDLRIRQLDGEGAYSLQGRFADDTLQAQMTLHEAAQGPLVRLAGLRDHDGLNLQASLEGPLSAVRSRAELKLDGLQALFDGVIDFVQTGADFTVTATAPAMQLRPDLAWQALALNAQFNGPLTSLNVNGRMHLDGLTVAQAAIGSLAIKLKGADGRIVLDGELAGLRIPAKQNDLLSGVPLSFQAKLGLDKPDHPIVFELKHPLLAASGQVEWEKKQSSAEMALTLHNLQPVAALAGFQLAGNADLTLKYNRQDDSRRLEAAGNLGVSGGNTSWAKLLGESAKFDLSMSAQGADIVLSGLHLNGKALTVSADGKRVAGNADFNWQAQLNDLAAIVTVDSGRLASHGRLFGALDNLMLSADLNGEMASKGYASSPINGNLQLSNLLHAPGGKISLTAMLAGAPVDMRLMVNSLGNQALQIGIDKAGWKSVQAKGSLMLTGDSPLPLGKIDLQVSRLADLQPLLDMPVSGSVGATLETSVQAGRPIAMLRLDARHAGLSGTAMIDRSSLALTVREPTGQALMNGALTLDGISAGAVNGSAQIKFDGSMDAVRLQLSAALSNLAGSDAQLSGDAQFNSGNRSLAVNTLQANWRKQTMQLLAPTTLSFAQGLAIDRLRLGFRQAELELSGRFSPELAVTAELHNASAELLSIFAPNLAMKGTLHADAELHGSFLRPIGRVQFDADKLQMQHGSGRALPPGRLKAVALLHGDVADLDVALSAGNDISLNIAGQAPLTHDGLFDLHSVATLDLKRLDPILNAEGRRVRGQLLVNSKLAGTWSMPAFSGSAQLNQGEWQDYAMGAEISDITAVLEADGGTLRISKLQGRAGPGTVTATGSVGLLLAGMPIDLVITARNARPLTGDRLTVNLDADVAVRGLAAEQLIASGRIRINRAEIRIPERMPTSIAVLKMSNAAVLAPPQSNSDIALNLTIDAPREIFVRGRGLDAELGGTVHVNGTIKKPRPDGAFKLRRGQFTLAGQALVFSQGSVGFEDGSLTNPSLNFVANTSRNNIIASLTIAGSALHPKIVLSSTPEMPPDEILANLLFAHGTANLSPLEMVQIASALASLSGVTVGIDDPLESARKRLGLDRLSAGGASSSVEGGRYIAPGVYLGAKQGILGGSPQATLQVDVSKRLKIEGSVGSGATPSGTSTTNSVGVLYQFEY